MVTDPAVLSSAQSCGDAEAPVALRISYDVLEALDCWIATRPEPRPTRQDAIGEILALGLQARARRAVGSSP